MKLRLEKFKDDDTKYLYYVMEQSVSKWKLFTKIYGTGTSGWKCVFQASFANFKYKFQAFAMKHRLTIKMHCNNLANNFITNMSHKFMIVRNKMTSFKHFSKNACGKYVGNIPSFSQKSSICLVQTDHCLCMLTQHLCVVGIWGKTDPKHWIFLQGLPLHL